MLALIDRPSREHLHSLKQLLAFCSFTVLTTSKLSHLCLVGKCGADSLKPPPKRKGTVTLLDASPERRKYSTVPPWELLNLWSPFIRTLEAQAPTLRIWLDWSLAGLSLVECVGCSQKVSVHDGPIPAPRSKQGTTLGQTESSVLEGAWGLHQWTGKTSQIQIRN